MNIWINIYARIMWTLLTNAWNIYKTRAFIYKDTREWNFSSFIIWKSRNMFRYNLIHFYARIMCTVFKVGSSFDRVEYSWLSPFKWNVWIFFLIKHSHSLIKINGSGRIFNFIKIGLQEVDFLTPTIDLTAHYCIWNNGSIVIES